MHTGGVAPYDYTWFPEPGGGQGDSIATGLYAGDWMVTVSDVFGCDTTISFTVGEPSAMEADSSVINASCNTVPGDGSILLTVMGGASPYDYQWFDANNNPIGTNSAIIVGLTQGIYHCEVTDDSSCTATFVAIVSDNGAEDITGGSEPAGCFGDNSGVAWVEYNCMDAPCTVNWYDALGADLGFTTDSIFNLAGGSYIVGVTNGSGCVAYENIVIDESPPLVVNVNVSQATCTGICDANANAIVTGGSGVYNYLWTPEPPLGQGTPIVSDLCSGEWNLTVTDEFGCSESFDFVVTDIEELVSNIEITQDSCSSDCDAYATVAPTGASGDYTYLWTPEPASGQGTDSASGLCPGDWSVLITDINTGCNLTETFSVGQTNPMMFTDTVYVQPECGDDLSGSIAVGVSGGIQPYAYQWLDNNLDPIPGATDSILSDVGAGAYFLNVTDSAGCELMGLFDLEATSDLVAYAGEDTSFCEGAGSITLVGQGNGISSVWMNILGNIISVGDTLEVDVLVGNFGYIYQVSDGICTADDTVYVVGLAAPEADAGFDQEIFQEESVEIGGDPTGPIDASFLWTPNETLSDSTDANPIATPPETTIYTVMVEDQNGCIGIDSMTVVVYPRFQPNNGFTPNDDGINDTWIIGDLSDFPNVEVAIFNRWGQQLFSSTGYNEPWDGRYDGKEVPVGTYYYVIDLKDEQYPEPFTGPLTIMR